MEWLTLDEAAKYLKLSKEALYRYAQRNRLPAVKLGRQWRFDRSELDGWLKKGSTQGRLFYGLPAVEEFGRRLKQAYGRRFRRLLLFGSWARSEATPESDIDLLVLLSDYRDYWKELQRIQRIAYEVTFGQDRPVVLSAFPAREEDYERGVTPLLSVIRQEGRAVA